jgi:hypothetical protein
MIRRHGFSWIYVGNAWCDMCSGTTPHPPHDEGPPFAYTVGLALTAKAPELLAAGLSHGVTAGFIASYAKRVQRGERIRTRYAYADFANLAVQFLPLHAAGKRQLGQAGNIHHGWAFPALQLIYPDAEGRWPWDPACDSKTRQAQESFCVWPRRTD